MRPSRNRPIGRDSPGTALTFNSRPLRQSGTKAVDARDRKHDPEIPATLLLLAGTSLGFAQNGTAGIDQTKPHVIRPSIGWKNDSVWLRLQNNSHWALKVQTENPGSSLTSLRLANGRTRPGLQIFFSVPRKDFRFASRLSVRFSYEWEADGGEVEHRVHFHESQFGCGSRTGGPDGNPVGYEASTRIIS